MRSLRLNLRRLARALFLCAAPLGGAAHATVLSLSLSTPVTSIGQRFTLDVILSELDAGQVVAGFDLDLIFDPALLQPARVNFGNGLGAVDIDQFTNALFGNGRVDFAAVSLAGAASLLGLQSAPFSLAQLEFNAVGAGGTEIRFDAFAAPGVLLINQFGDPLPVTASDVAFVRVEPAIAVTAPPTLLLLLLGMLLAVWRSPPRPVTA